ATPYDPPSALTQHAPVLGTLHAHRVAQEGQKWRAGRRLNPLGGAAPADRAFWNRLLVPDELGHAGSHTRSHNGGTTNPGGDLGAACAVCCGLDVGGGRRLYRGPLRLVVPLLTTSTTVFLSKAGERQM